MVFWEVDFTTKTGLASAFSERRATRTAVFKGRPPGEASLPRASSTYLSRWRL